MTKLLEDRIVVVTGGSRGIGRAIALACARHGADVVVNYWTNPLLPTQADHEIDALVDAIRATGRDAQGGYAERMAAGNHTTAPPATYVQ